MSARDERKMKKAERAMLEGFSKVDPHCLIWRTGAFAGEFGDSFIEDSDLEGGHTAPALVTLASVIHGVLSKRRSELSLFSDEDVAKFQNVVMKDMDAARVTMIEMREMSQDNMMHVWLAAWMERLKAMKEGDRVVFSGGWMRRDGGHAIMHVLVKEKEGFGLAVNNTGAGVNYHPSSPDFFPKQKRLTSMYITGITDERVLSNEYWYCFFKMQITAKPENSVSHLYEVMIPDLTGNTSFVDSIDMAKSGHFETIQRAGTCYYRCILCVMRYLLKMDGFSQNQQKELYTLIRRGFMDRVLTDLGRVKAENKHFTDSDKRMILLGCHQTALASVKLSRRLKENFGRTGLADDVALQVEEVRRALDTIPDCYKFELDSEYKDEKPSLGACAPMVPFHGFGLLASIPVVSQSPNEFGNTDILAGSLVEASPDMFVDLRAPMVTKEKMTLKDIQMYIADVKERCDQLRSKTSVSSPSLATFQICSLVEHTFGTVVPVPLGPGAPARAVPAVASGAASSPSLALSSPSLSGMVIDVTEETDLDKLVKDANGGLVVVDFYAPWCQPCKNIAPVVVELAKVYAGRAVFCKVAAKELCAKYKVAGFPTFKFIMGGEVIEEMSGADEGRLRSTVEMLARPASAATSTHTISSPADASASAAENPLEPKTSAFVPTCPYIAGASTLTLKLQRQLLADLAVVSEQYISAHWSKDNDQASDSTRKIVMAAIMCIFDAVARIHASDAVSPFSALLVHGLVDDSKGVLVDGKEQKETKTPGFSFSSTSFAGDSLSAQSEYWMITDPAICLLKHDVLSYIDSGYAGPGTNNLFDFQFSPQGNFIVCQKDDVNLKFVQQLLKKTNKLYESPPRKNGKTRDRGGSEGDVDATTDIEKYALWLCNGDPVAFPEFSQYRNMNIMFRVCLNETAAFFEANYGFRYLTNLLTVHVQMMLRLWQTDGSQKFVMLRPSMANHDAELRIKCKPTKVSVCQSVRASYPHEEAVLHELALNTCKNALSDEEAERLWSVLTAPYISIPLMLQFFCDDRVALLLHRHLQAVVESVMFEPLAWTKHAVTKDMITTVPVDSAQRSALLGTQYGLLFNEVARSPVPLLTSLTQLSRQAVDLCIGDYKSSFVGLLMFIIRLTTKVRKFFFAVRQVEKKHMLDDPNVGTLLASLDQFFTDRAVPLLKKWLGQSEKAENMSISTLLQTHYVLITSVFLSKAAEAETLPNEQMITAFMCSTAYVVSWHSGSDTKPENCLVDDRTQSLHPVPIADVFSELQANRNVILQWVQQAVSTDVDKVLAKIVASSLQKQNLAADDDGEGDSARVWQGWQRQDERPLQCSYTVESPHPYLPNTDTYETIRFPGANYLSIYFDSQTSTETNQDYITLYKDDSYGSHWGTEQRFSGDQGKGGWPGIGGSAPLIIPADSFVLHFHSDGSRQDWGYKITVVAQVDVKTAQHLADDLVNPSTGAHFSLDVCQQAMAEAKNVPNEATRILKEKGPQMEFQLEAEKKEKQMLDDLKRNKQGHSSSVPKAEENRAAGLYRDPLGIVQVNLQAAQVYLRNRMLMPVPGDIAGSREFQDVFKVGRGGSQLKEIDNSPTFMFGRSPGPAKSKSRDREGLYCAVVANTTNRRMINVMHGGRLYEVQAWKPITFDAKKSINVDALEAGAEAKQMSDAKDEDSRGSSGAVVASLGGLTDQQCYNMPQRDPANRRNLLYDNTVFEPYTEGSLGWVSELFDEVLKENIDRMEISDQPVVWASKETKGLVQRCTADRIHSVVGPAMCGQLLMYLPPQGDLEQTKGHPGGFFEVQALYDRSVVQVFALVESGRLLQRVCVFSTDSRFCLSHFSKIEEERKEPWLPGCRFSEGNLFGTILNDQGDLLARAGVGINGELAVGSVVIKRSRKRTAADVDAEMLEAEDRQAWGDKEMDLQGSDVDLRKKGREEEMELYVPKQFLEGLIPSCLLEEYEFWKTGPRVIRGYSTAAGTAFTSLLIILQQQIVFQQTALSKDVRPVSVDCLPDEKVKDVRRRACRLYHLSEEDILTDIEGRPLRDDQAVCDTGVAQWVAVVKRLHDYNVAPTSTAGPESDEKQVSGQPDEAKTNAGADSAVEGGKDEALGLTKSANAKNQTDSLTLLNLLRVSLTNAYLGVVVRVLTRLDNLSHITCWSSSDGHIINDMCALTLVELPRLKLRFEVKATGGETRLYSLDYAGLYLSVDPVVPNS